MKWQLPTLIIVCLSVVLILTAHFLGRNTQSIQDISDESEEFQLLRDEAYNAYVAKDFTQAIDKYEQALELRPKNAEVCNDLGAAHYDLGLEYAGPDWPTWRIRKETLDEAIADLDLAIQTIESGYIKFRINSTELAEAFEKHAKTKGAAVFHYKGNMQTTLNILIGSTKDHLLHARSLYRRSLELKPTYAPAYRNLGSFYMKIGIRDKAVNYLREAYRREPSDEELAEYIRQFRKEY